ncbi:unnamed protein product [Strongylus vulgaris]|uniref:Methyltransferase domain-containing protein n=1 Tax=Strongylus vulgaris TaxID=40348 RepID=A0A3P7J282_STRVU|nr:unnamed protein product [Strongylus vulgaris]
MIPFALPVTTLEVETCLKNSCACRAFDNILQIGCGNSQLAAQMYDNGFRAVHSIDTDSAVIDEQRLRNKHRPELVFDVDDATSVCFSLNKKPFSCHSNL